MVVTVSVPPPPFFVAQTNKGFNGSFFPPGSEAEHRISYFAQSLTTALPEALPVDTMPTFTVLTPHYNEKVCFPPALFLLELFCNLLKSRSCVRYRKSSNSQLVDLNTRITLLKYLQQLHSLEWENFVKGTKILARESDLYDSAFPGDEKGSSKLDDLLRSPLACHLPLVSFASVNSTFAPLTSAEYTHMPVLTNMLMDAHVVISTIKSDGS